MSLGTVADDRKTHSEKLSSQKARLHYVWEKHIEEWKDATLVQLLDDVKFSLFYSYLSRDYDPLTAVEYGSSGHVRAVRIDGKEYRALKQKVYPQSQTDNE